MRYYSASLTDSEARGWGKGWPTDRWSDMRLVQVPSPAGPVKAYVHAIIAPIVDHLLRRTIASGYVVRPKDTGGYNNRPMVKAGGGLTKTPSNHSRGTALDINWNSNPLTSDPSGPAHAKLITDYPFWLPTLWETVDGLWAGDRPFYNWGGRWGADGGIYDAMHFEVAVTIQEARTIAERIGLGGGSKVDQPPVLPTRPTPPSTTIIEGDPDVSEIKRVPMVVDNNGNGWQIVPDGVTVEQVVSFGLQVPAPDTARLDGKGVIGYVGGDCQIANRGGQAVVVVRGAAPNTEVTALVSVAE